MDRMVNRIDAAVSRLNSVELTGSVRLALEEAADAVFSCEAEMTQEVLSATATSMLHCRNYIAGAKADSTGSCLVIPIPKMYADRFPDPDTHNKGYLPHLTVLYISPETTPGEASSITYLLRSVANKFRPFRIFVDTQSGLDTFGDGDDGQKALWLPARSDPRGEVERFHRASRQLLDIEGIEVHAHEGFTPHVTWSYVPNDVSDDVVRRMDNHASDRFPGGIWFDVHHLILELPNGVSKVIPLNPLAE